MPFDPIDPDFTGRAHPLSRRRLGLASIAAMGLIRPTGLHAADSFATWVQGVRRDAAAAGVSRATLDRAFSGIQPIPRVVELDQKQPEGQMSFATYRQRVVSDSRIARGQALVGQHAEVLRRVRDQYGVPPKVVVALWGVESNFGDFKGKFSVVGSLATLAYEGRRAAFFRKELISALRILDRGDVTPERMDGSWAGAMGQSQFMPSTYLAYAVDFDGDGRRDIWGSLPDVFASIANYLAHAGWDPNYIWGREVLLSNPVPSARLGLGHKASLAAWDEAGVRSLDRSPLPAVPIRASLLAMVDGNGPTFLAYDNFRVFMAWNRSTYFALSVGLLADAIGNG
jgi:membrane-bound lytic murein transglycosylase B